LGKHSLPQHASQGLAAAPLAPCAGRPLAGQGPAGARARPTRPRARQGILLELPLADFFLKKLLLRGCDLNDLPTLDAELYRSLLLLRDYAGDVEDLALTFTASNDLCGRHVEARAPRPACARAACTRAACRRPRRGPVLGGRMRSLMRPVPLRPAPLRPPARAADVLRHASAGRSGPSAVAAWGWRRWRPGASTERHTACGWRRWQRGASTQQCPACMRGWWRWRLGPSSDSCAARGGRGSWRQGARVITCAACGWRRWRPGPSSDGCAARGRRWSWCRAASTAR